jgi:hypothetical protein
MSWLDSHHLEALRDGAEARGFERMAWFEDPVAACLGTALAVAKCSASFMSQGMHERQALSRSASELYLDYETLIRQKRATRRRRSAVDTSPEKGGGSISG